MKAKSKASPKPVARATGPPNAAIRFLAGFCREHPLDEKIFIVPSFIVGRQIGEALARAAGSWGDFWRESRAYPEPGGFRALPVGGDPGVVLAQR